MTRLYFLISVALLCSLYSNAQYCSPNTELESTIDIWDWTQKKFEVYIRNTTTGTTNFEIIHSPFHGTTVSQPNTDHLRLTNLLDYHPEDGWELVFKEFGEESNGVRMPSFSLYNRYTGKLRIFYFIADIDGIDQIVLTLKNETTNFSHISAILEHAFTPMDVIENYQDKGIVIETPNYFEGNAGLWVMADIPTAYDPCTCKFPSALKTKNISITTDSLYLNLQGNGTIEQIIEEGENLENENQLFNRFYIKMGGLLMCKPSIFYSYSIIIIALIAFYAKKNLLNYIKLWQCIKCNAGKIRQSFKMLVNVKHLEKY